MQGLGRLLRVILIALGRTSRFETDPETKEIFSLILCRQIGVKKNGQQYAMK